MKKKNNPLDEQFDALVLQAVRGDRRAISAIAVACGPTLLQVAREALGPERAREDEDVLQDLCASMGQGTLQFVPGQDSGREWLRAQVQALAIATPSDRVVARATDGDPEAVAEVLDVFKDMLLEEARSVLGDSLACDAEVVVQDLEEQLLEGGLSFKRGTRRGIGFLRRSVRAIARERTRTAPRPFDVAAVEEVGE